MSRHAYFEGVCGRGRILFKKIEKALSGWTYIEFLNHLCRYRYGKIEWSQLKSDIADIFGNSGVSGDLVHEFNDFIRFYEKTTILKKAGSPSYYWVLNENEDIPKASQRTELEHQVLNDTFICVNLDTKNCARKSNIEEHEHDGGITEEELWNEFEDVKHMKDMMVVSLSSTIGRAEKLLQNLMIQADDSGMQPIHIEGHVRSVDLRRIVKFYGRRGRQIFQLLMDNPRDALPGILRDLQLKLEQLKEAGRLFSFNDYLLTNT